MNNQCQYIKSDNIRCSRKTKNKYCWQHKNKIKKHYIFNASKLILFLGAIIGIIVNVPKLFKKETYDFPLLDPKTIQCNRNLDLGCSIELNNFIGRNAYTPESLEEEIRYRIINLKSGDYKCLVTTPVLKYENQKVSSIVPFTSFPKISNFETKFHYNGPYKIKLVQDTAKFYGEIFDIKTEELIGWFDGNEFGRIGNCSLSWNKDSKGVEIIDKYGNVVFSLELKKYKNGQFLERFLCFKGFYKSYDLYYIFNENETTITEDKILALEKIKLIEPIFDHFGENSTGKRIKY